MTFQHPVGKINRQKIINVVIQLGGKDISPKQILNFLYEEAVREVENWCRDTYSTLSPSQKETEIKKRIMSETALFTGLKILTEKEKSLVNNNGKYSINDKMRSDIRHFAPQFGGQALAAIMSNHLPTFYKLEKNLDDLIKIFGIYVVYCFIEAARPFVGEDTLLSTREKDILASSWVRDVFTLGTMYNFFMAAILNQPEDKEVEEYWQTFKVDENGYFIFRNETGQPIAPPSTTDLATERFYFLASKELNFDKGKPKYELDSKKIKKVTDLLKKKYPLYYESLFQAHADFLGKPKYWSVRELRKKITYFDAKEEDEEQ